MDEDEVAAGRAASEPLTVFVKNLSFSTDEAGLRSCFQKAGLSVRSVSIPRKKGPGASEAKLSMGYGFVECVDKSLVEKALKVRYPRCCVAVVAVLFRGISPLRVFVGVTFRLLLQRLWTFMDLHAYFACATRWVGGGRKPGAY